MLKIYKKEDKLVKVNQIKLNKMGLFAYIVIDKATGKCALIDPSLDIPEILQILKKERLKVTHIINTSGNSEHTAGNADIMKATKAKLLIHELDHNQLVSVMNATFSRFMGGKGSPKATIKLKENDVIPIGKIGLKVIHTPGHTPGSICLYIKGHVFTGNTLFVGGVGRTDLHGGSLDELLKSINEKLYTLPDDTVVWPGHDYGSIPHSTIKREKETNPYTRLW